MFRKYILKNLCFIERVRKYMYRTISIYFNHAGEIIFIPTGEFLERKYEISDLNIYLTADRNNTIQEIAEKLKDTFELCYFERPTGTELSPEMKACFHCKRYSEIQKDYKYINMSFDAAEKQYVITPTRSTKQGYDFLQEYVMKESENVGWDKLAKALINTMAQCESEFYEKNQSGELQEVEFIDGSYQFRVANDYIPWKSSAGEVDGLYVMEVGHTMENPFSYPTISLQYSKYYDEREQIAAKEFLVFQKHFESGYEYNDGENQRIGYLYRRNLDALIHDYCYEVQVCIPNKYLGTEIEDKVNADTRKLIDSFTILRV